MRPWKQITLLLILVAIWASSLWWFPRAASLVLPDQDVPSSEDARINGQSAMSATPSATDIGSVGDWFGAVNALFSGLALIGVGYSLYRQAEYSRRAVKPLLHPVIDSAAGLGGVTVLRYNVENGAVLLPISIAIKLQNLSAEVALDADVDVEVNGHAISIPVGVGRPLTANDQETVTIKGSLKGDAASAWIRELEAGRGEVAVVVKYQSVEEIKRSTHYRFRLTIDPSDVEVLQLAVSQTDQTASAWGGGKKVQFDVAPITGTWRWKPL